VRGLTAGYGKRVVLKQFQLSVDSSDAVAVIGPNGCGKSTLLSAITTILRPAGGTVKFRGCLVHHLPTDEIIRMGIGLVRQVRNVFPSLTVGENLELSCLRRGSAYRERLDQLLECFPTLRPQLRERAGLLSGGQRQVLAVSMALMRHVSLLLLDEPVAGLSPESASMLLKGLGALRLSEGFAMILVEHRLRAIQSYVNRVVIMIDGEACEDTRDTSILSDLARLERYYRL